MTSNLWRLRDVDKAGMGGEGWTLAYYAAAQSTCPEDVAVLRADQLKTRIWRDVLTCMDGRVKDHNFMTLPRPDASLSYDEQR